MRLTAKQKQQVLDACVVTRPGAKLLRKGEHWVAVWAVEYDALIDPTVRVSSRAKWRAQVVTGVETNGTVWWNGTEGQAGTRRAAIEEALL